MRLLLAGVAAGVVALSLAVSAQSGPRRDGNWEVTMEMDMPGMPQGMSMPPMKMTQCITPQEAADPQKLVPQQPQRGGGNSNCSVSDYKMEGNKATWTMACTGAQAMTGTGEVVYANDSYTGTMKMNMDRGGQPMAMTMKYSGKRLGDCAK